MSSNAHSAPIVDVVASADLSSPSPRPTVELHDPPRDGDVKHHGARTMFFWRGMWRRW